MPRRRRSSPSSQQAPRIRSELRPSGRDADVPDDRIDGDDLDTLDDAAFERRLTGTPDQPARAQSGTAVGVLLGFGVLLGAIVAFVLSLPILPALAIGGVTGAIAGIVIDRRRAAGLQETLR